MSYCPVCGAKNGHINGCPEAPQPKPVYTCHECGEGIYEGDIYYRAGRFIFCMDCCGTYEAELPEPDEE